MRVIIAGGRDFTDYDLMNQYLRKIFKNTSYLAITVISGTAKGADLLGERFANENDINLVRFPADWDKYGKSAGYKRNEEMANNATHCICFWDGISRGTKNMIDLAKKYNLELRVVMY